MHAGWVVCVFSARNYFRDEYISYRDSQPDNEEMVAINNDCAFLLLAQGARILDKPRISCLFATPLLEAERA